jgi:meso-butanediol dehydrogenase/(S,S)-butanediol dehydrogenase/diacetyl reductase
LMSRLNGKVAIVTGAAAGIGEAVSKLFAMQGAQVACVDCDRVGLERICSAIRDGGGSAHAFAADVSESSEISSAVEGILRRWGKIDILFNNAGIVVGGKIHMMDEESWDKVFRVNVKSIFLFSRAVLPIFLRQRGGVILNTSSATALRSVTDRAAYNASKSAVLSLTRTMAIDYSSDGIRVNCLCPGTVDTPSLQQRLGGSARVRESFIARQPLGRLGTPEEIALAALYLVSEDASFITGTALQIDGGMSL